MNQLWMRQIGGVLRLELKKTFLSKRAWWIYLLALGPVAITLLHWMMGSRRSFGHHSLGDDTQAFAAMFSRKMPDKARSMTFAAMCGMCADGTDLGVAVERDTFAAHCDQFAAGSHSIVGAHFARAAAEETRERKVSECDHLVCICARERDDPGNCAGGRDLSG